MKKWIKPALLALGLGALVLPVGMLLTWLASFAIENKTKIEALKTLADLLYIPVAALVAILTFVVNLWRGKQKEDSKPPLKNIVQNAQAGGDVNVAGGTGSNVQTGGVNIPAQGDVSVGGDVVGGNKTVIDGDEVHGDKIVHNHPSASPAVKALHQLRRPPADFTGREDELGKLRAAIKKAGGAAISGLQGQGGVGKTALALKLAAELSPQYPEAQIMVDLKGASQNPLTPAEAMAHVIRSFHPEAKLPEGEADLGGIYHTVLHGKRALLLMDNARDAAQVRPLIPPQDCALLVTSRQHFTLPGLHAENLDVLPPDDARKLLLAIAKRIGSEARAIAKACGYLPQALRLAATALKERVDLAPAEYARRLADEKSRLELLSEKGKGKDESVEASIHLSYGLLDAERQQRWRMLGVFPDTFQAPAAAAVWGIEGGDTPDETKNTLSRLVNYSLLEWNDAAKRYRLHDLMRDFARARMETPERDAAARRHAGHYKAVLAAADGLYLKGGEAVMRGLALFDAEWGNIQAGQAWATTRMARDAAGDAPRDEKDDSEAARLCSAYPDTGAYCLGLRQHPREWIGWLEAALAAARNLKDRAAEGRHLGNLGNRYAELDEMRRAIECYEQALAIDRENGDRRGEGQDLGNLGVAYKNLGEMRRAIVYHEKSLLIKREIGDRRGEGNSLGNLGVAYKNLGETRRAIEYFEQALAIHREIGDRRGEGNDLWNMSLALDKLGKRQQAIEHAEAALQIYEQIEDPHAGKVRSKLAEWKKQ